MAPDIRKKHESVLIKGYVQQVEVADMTIDVWSVASSDMDHIFVEENLRLQLQMILNPQQAMQMLLMCELKVVTSLENGGRITNLSLQILNCLWFNF